MKSERENVFLQGVERVHKKPISLQENLIGTPSHYIPIYNPNRVLPTAEEGLAKTLDETYKMKDNVTEESVMDYFNEMLAGFDENNPHDGELRKQKHSKTDHSKVEQPNVRKLPERKTENSKNADEFYFQKSSWSKNDPAEKKVYEITTIDRKQKSAEKKLKQQALLKQQQQQPIRKLSSNEKTKYVVQDTKNLDKVTSLHSKGSIEKKNNSNQLVVQNKQKTELKKPKVKSASKRNEYTIELYSTNTNKLPKQETLLRSDSSVTKKITSPSINQPQQPVNKDEVPEGDTTLVYSTVRGFDSFMMY